MEKYFPRAWEKVANSSEALEKLKAAVAYNEKHKLSERTKVKSVDNGIKTISYEVCNCVGVANEMQYVMQLDNDDWLSFEYDLMNAKYNIPTGEATKEIKRELLKWINTLDSQSTLTPKKKFILAKLIERKEVFAPAVNTSGINTKLCLLLVETKIHKELRYSKQQDLCLAMGINYDSFRSAKRKTLSILKKADQLEIDFLLEDIDDMILEGSTIVPLEVRSTVSKKFSEYLNGLRQV